MVFSHARKTEIKIKSLTVEMTDWLCVGLSEVSSLLYTKFPTTLMVLVVVINEGHVETDYFLSTRPTYIKVCYLH